MNFEKNMKKQISISIFFLLSINIFAQSVPAYVPANGLTGWYSFTGNANEMTGSGNNGIVVGATLTTDRFGNNNSAYSFNGVGNHISIPAQFFDIGGNAYTISCWSNTNIKSNPNNGNHNQALYNTAPHNGLLVAYNWGGSSNKYGVFAGSNPPSSGWDVLGNVLSTDTASLNTWTNIILIKSGTTYSLYINGVLDNTFIGSTTVANQLCKMVIGSTDSTVIVESFSGKLDDFGFWNRALTPQEVTQVYQSNAACIPTNGLTAWYPFTGNANDMSGLGNNGIVVGATLTTDRFGNSNSAYFFDGVANHISIPNKFFDIGWNAYTISCWSNTNTLANPNNGNQSQALYNTAPHNGLLFAFDWGGSSNKYGVFAGSNPPSSGWDVLGNVPSTTSGVINTWTNTILVKSGTTYSLYINGVLDNTYTGSTTVISQLCKMVIGSTDSTVIVETFSGKLDDFGFWNRALTSQEITQVYQCNAADNNTSVKNVINSANLKIYPNPATNFLNIELSNLNKKTQLKVVNILGKEVIAQQLQNNQENIKLDVSSLANGVYFIMLESGNNTYVEKLIINK